jgi:hypothetical protein
MMTPRTPRTLACILLASIGTACEPTVTSPITTGSTGTSNSTTSGEGGGASSGAAAGGASSAVGNGGGVSSTGSSPITGGPTPGACSGSGGTGGGVVEPGPFTGVWKGYVENYAFADGSDTVVMTLDAVTAQVAGHVTFANSSPPPPPTDPDVGYPPGTSDPNFPMIYGGFSYSLLAGTFDGQRLKFNVAPRELWKQWCELQTSYADEVNPGNYGCLPNWGGGSTGGQCYQQNPATHEVVYVDCEKLQLCAFLGSMVCHCCAEGCTADMENAVSFDMVLAPPNADGSVDLGGVHNVHLTLQ